jgi:siderophore synthetase component
MNPHHHARQHITAAVLAAAWRENLAGIRDRATTQHQHITVKVHTGTLHTTATHHAYDQITIHDTIHIDNTPIHHPSDLLNALTPHTPQHLHEELDDAITGLTTALTAHQQLTTTLRQQTTRHHTTTALATELRADDPTAFLPCRFFEPLAVYGHHLHPLARTRLGWTDIDRQQYDLESRQTTPLRFVAADRRIVAATTDSAGEHLDTRLARQHPELAPYLDDDHHLIPVHPWQHQHVLTTRHSHAYDTGQLHDIPVTIDTAPTSSIRTLVTSDGTYLKCSLDIHITSTRRGISPATVHNGPVLSALLQRIIDNDPVLKTRIAILPEHAGISLYTGRDLSCLLRDSLTTVTGNDELPVPATALTAISPLTGHSILSELITEHAQHTRQTTPQAAADFLHQYSNLLTTATTHLAGRYGIGAEAHLQNCVPTFTHGRPRKIIIRDLGGIRIHTPRLHHSGHRPELHPESIITTTDLDTMRAKISYTVFQNHLAALITTLETDQLIPATTAWRTVADTLHHTDIPHEDRAFHTANTTPHKALLTMRINENGDEYTHVHNPLHRP